MISASSKHLPRSHLQLLNPLVAVFQKTTDSEFFLVDATEWVSDTENPIFKKTFTLEYFHSETYRFKVYNVEKSNNIREEDIIGYVDVECEDLHGVDASEKAQHKLCLPLTHSNENEKQRRKLETKGSVLELRVTTLHKPPNTTNSINMEISEDVKTQNGNKELPVTKMETDPYVGVTQQQQQQQQQPPPQPQQTQPHQQPTPTTTAITTSNTTQQETKGPDSKMDSKLKDSNEVDNHLKFSNYEISQRNPSEEEVEFERRTVNQANEKNETNTSQNDPVVDPVLDPVLDPNASDVENKESSQPDVEIEKNIENELTEEPKSNEVTNEDNTTTTRPEKKISKRASKSRLKKTPVNESKRTLTTPQTPPTSALELDDTAPKSTGKSRPPLNKSGSRSNNKGSKRNKKNKKNKQKKQIQ